MSENDLTLQSVSICAYAEYEGAEQLIEYFKDIRDISPPPEYSNRIIDIKDEELADSELLFGPSGPDTPSELEMDSVEVNVSDGADDDDESLHIHMNASAHHVDDAFSIFKDAISEVGVVEVHVTSIEVALHCLLADLNLPIDVSGDYELNGGRLVNGDQSYLLQEVDDGEHTILRHGNTEWFEVDAEEADNLIEQMVDRVEEFLERIES